MKKSSQLDWVGNTQPYYTPVVLVILEALETTRAYIYIYTHLYTHIMSNTLFGLLLALCLDA